MLATVLGAGIVAGAVPLGLKLASTQSSGDTPSPHRSGSPRPTSGPASASASPLLTQTLDSNAYTGALSPDGKTFALGQDNVATTLWDSATLTKTGALQGHVSRKFPREDLTVRELAFSPNGALLAGAVDNKTVLWDVAARTQVATLIDTEVDPLLVRSVTFSPDGRILACTNANATITLWNTSTRTKITTLIDPIRYTEDFRKVMLQAAFSPDGSTMAVSTVYDEVHFWEISSQKITGTISGLDVGYHALAYSPDGTILATGTTKESVKLWHADTHTLITTLSSPTRSVSEGYVFWVAFSPDGTTLAASDNVSILLWDLTTHRIIATLSATQVTDKPGALTALRYSPDSTKVMATTLNHVVVWKLH